MMAIRGAHTEITVPGLYAALSAAIKEHGGDLPYIFLGAGLSLHEYWSGEMVISINFSPPGDNAGSIATVFANDTMILDDSTACDYRDLYHKEEA